MLRNIYIALVVLLGALCLVHGAVTWTNPEPAPFLSLCLIGLFAAGTKIQLPWGEGTISMGFLVVFVAISQFGLGEALLLGILGCAVQIFFRPKFKPTPLQIAFNVASASLSVYLTYQTRHAEGFESIVLAATTYFIVNTLSISIVVALSERKSIMKIWGDQFFWYPNYLVGAAAAWVVAFATRLAGWEAGLLLLPLLFVIYQSQAMYRSRLKAEQAKAEQQRVHADEVAQLHRRTIVTLAIAIEAKDQTTKDHLERVETYAVEVGRELGFSEEDIEALRAAALLHDIGKIAVPEYIIAKPGKLTPDEFEKMKTHTVVGAELVERIRFPFEVAPLVRGHHEKWNGQGYPDGLAGEQIPIGARILAAVDTLDALISDRQYRRAMPLTQAIEVLKAESGKSFDPAIVEILARRYTDFEVRTQATKPLGRLSTDVVVSRGLAPATGFEKIADATPAMPLASSSAHSMALDLLSLAENLTGCADGITAFDMLRSSVDDMIPCEALVVYLKRDRTLIPEYSSGKYGTNFAALRIPWGSGLSGWVAENRREIVNGNPSVEPGYPDHFPEPNNLRSALAVPLATNEGVTGVIALYRKEEEAFTLANLSALRSMATAFTDILNRTPQSRTPEPPAPDNTLPNKALPDKTAPDKKQSSH